MKARSSRLVWVAVVALGLGAAIFPGPVPAQQRLPPGRVAVFAPERTDAGAWSGTWYYKTRDEKWALWMREENGVPEMRIQYQNYDDGENFATDWTTAARYASDGMKGEFRLDFTQRDVDLIQGSWYWKLGTEGVDDRVRLETSEFQIYRARRGRQLVLKLDRFVRSYTGTRPLRVAGDQARTFHKASRRLAGWRELPF
jgi:hypothetical protein